jgi:hypothetical protein
VVGAAKGLALTRPNAKGKKRKARRMFRDEDIMDCCSFRRLDFVGYL